MPYVSICDNFLVEPNLATDLIFEYIHITDAHSLDGVMSSVLLDVIQSRADDLERLRKLTCTAGLLGFLQSDACDKFIQTWKSTMERVVAEFRDVRVFVLRETIARLWPLFSEAYVDHPF